MSYGQITLNDLPVSSLGKKGWPWTEQSVPLPEMMPDGSPWPKVSVITPSYNQGQFLEEAIRSVLLQGYPNLEYIIMDGGSTDTSVEVIQKYDPWISYWVSEKDRGQSHALNKGFQLATGEIIGWLNADDMYTPGAFQSIWELQKNTETRVIYSDCLWIDKDRHLVGRHHTGSYSMERLIAGGILQTPSVFLNRSLLETAGYLDESLHYAMDTDFWFRVCPIANPLYVENPLGFFRRQAKSKTLLQETEFGPERIKVYEKIFCQEPFKSAVSEERKRRLLGEIYWRAGVVMCDHGQTSRAQPYIKKAINEYRVLSQDFAINAVIFHFSDGKLLTRRQIAAIVQSLPLSSQSSRSFRRRVWTQYNIAQFFEGHKRGEAKAVWINGLKMLLRDPTWLLNRGYRSIWIRSWIGKKLSIHLQTLIKGR
jgi:glycosyltransferase involved in cell wall biosynthesis